VLYSTAGIRVGALVLALAIAGPSGAQGYPFSQRGVVGQTVAFTEITIEYGRPVARGRLLFGDSGVVKWNAIWHPGADSATRITFSHDIVLEGHNVSAGEYSVWLLPRQNAPWTLILNRAVHVLHTPYPGEATDVLRVDIPAESGAHMETLAYYFPSVVRDDAVLRIHWGETFVAIHLKAPYRPGSPPTSRVHPSSLSLALASLH
jgi:hypothetical protein